MTHMMGLGKYPMSAATPSGVALVVGARGRRGAPSPPPPPWVSTGSYTLTGEGCQIVPHTNQTMLPWHLTGRLLLSERQVPDSGVPVTDFINTWPWLGGSARRHHESSSPASAVVFDLLSFNRVLSLTRTVDACRWWINPLIVLIVIVYCFFFLLSVLLMNKDVYIYNI